MLLSMDVNWTSHSLHLHARNSPMREVRSHGLHLAELVGLVCVPVLVIALVDDLSMFTVP